MNIRLADHKLGGWNDGTKIQVGTKVCSGNGAYSVGIVVDVGKSESKGYPWRGRSITVLWGTGNKRGKREVKNSTLLTNFDAFLKTHREEYERLQKMADEASTVGL